jgi:ring-1,2-phenylacetyl-CoA epoxidase subunit PaaD
MPRDEGSASPPLEARGVASRAGDFSTGRCAAVEATTPDGKARAGDPHERVRRAWTVLDRVLDPEVPVVSVVELGIVRDVRVEGDALAVALTPTYSGCPATELIEASVRSALEEAGLGPTALRMQRSPAWTTDWITEKGRRKLREYGIAPPGAVDASRGVAIGFVDRRRHAALPCPRCESTHTERLSAFGSTACKALYRCRACGEPFEHFKPI